MYGYLKTRPNNRTSDIKDRATRREAVRQQEESIAGLPHHDHNITRKTSISSETAGYLSWESISYFFGKWTTDEGPGPPPLGKKLEETQVDSDLIEHHNKQRVMLNMENTTEYTVTSFDTLPKIALKFDVTPSELTRLNKLVMHTLYPGQVLKVPCPKPVESCSECTEEEILENKSPKSMSMNHHHHIGETSVVKRVSFDDIDADVEETFIKVKSKYITDGQGVVKGFLLITPHAVIFRPDVSEILVVDKGADYFHVHFPMDSVCAAGMFNDIAEMAVHESLQPGHFFLDKPLTELLGDSNYTGEGEKIDEELTSSGSTLHPLSTSGDYSADFLTESTENIGDEQSNKPLISPEEMIAKDIMNDLLEQVNQRIKGHVGEHDSELTTDDIVVSSSSHGVLSPNDHPLLTEAELLPHVTSSSHVHHQMNSTPKLAPYRGTRNEASEGKDGDIDGHSYSEGISKDSGIDDHLSHESSDIPLIDDPRSWKEHNTDRGKTALVESSEFLPRPSTCHVDMPKYLCVRIKKGCWRALRPRLCSHAHEEIQRASDERREFWFSIPSARLFDVYAFFLEKCPAIHDGETDEEVSDMETDLVGSCGSDYSVITMSDIDAEGFKLFDNYFSRSPGKKNISRKRTHSRGKKKLNKKPEKEMAPRKSSSWSICTLDEPMLPDLIGKSEILNECDVLQLSQKLPSRTVGHSWRLVYSTSVNGISLKTLYRSMASYDSPALLVIRDKSGKVFGVFASDPLAVSEHFYGTGECFLYTFSPEFKTYHWTGDNNFFIKGDIDSLAFGGGAGNFGLWLDEDLYHGSSHPCKTFNNDPLTVNVDFLCCAVETWCFE